jgi:hypothetical protein
MQNGGIAAELLPPRNPGAPADLAYTAHEHVKTQVNPMAMPFVYAKPSKIIISFVSLNAIHPFVEKGGGPLQPSVRQEKST